MIETQVRPVQKLEFIVQETPVDFKQAHAEYIESGGQLDLVNFQFVTEFSPPEETAEETDLRLSQRPYLTSNYQAIGMDKYTGVDLSDRERQLYVLLRNQFVKGELPEVTGKRPQTMTDQHLMAEILRLTSPEKMAIFTSKYSAIFPEMQQGNENQ